MVNYNAQGSLSSILLSSREEILVHGCVMTYQVNYHREIPIFVIKVEMHLFKIKVRTIYTLKIRKRPFSFSFVFESQYVALLVRQGMPVRGDSKTSYVGVISGKETVIFKGGRIDRVGDHIPSRIIYYLDLDSICRPHI